jgi:hypothetical protein
MKRTTQRMVLLAALVILSVFGTAVWLGRRQSAKRNSFPPDDQNHKQPIAVQASQNVSASPSTKATPQQQPANQTENVPLSDEIDDVRPLTTLQVFNLSTRVVLAKCRSVAARKEAGGNIFTFLEFETINTIKGPNDAVVPLRLLGGRVGDTEVSSASIPSFKTGEEVVLFLGRENRDGYPTLFPQGVFRVRTNPVSKTKVVVPKPTGLRLFNAQDNKPYSTSPDFLPLQDFLLSLRKLK